MRLGYLLGVVGAVGLHVFMLLFGGAFFSGGAAEGSFTEVDLLSAEDPGRKEEKKDPEPSEPIEEQEPPPDATEILKSLESPTNEEPPALDALSLRSIEAALDGEVGSGAFAQAMSLASGGQLGGTGKGGVDDQFAGAFSMAETDQKPRALFQTQPMYPAELRGKKLEGVVSVLFVVDTSGKVTNARADKSSHTAFESPALAAVKKWRFEPAMRGGQRVPCKMRVSLRFPPS